jgi:hypothetical protein
MTANVIVELRVPFSDLSSADTDRMLDALSVYRPAIGIGSDDTLTAFILTLDYDEPEYPWDLVEIGCWRVMDATEKRYHWASAQVMLTSEFDRRNTL